MLRDEVQTLLESAPHVLELLRGAKANSLIEYTKTTRVEPVTLVDQRCIHLPYTTDILQSLTSIFAGYYLQAVAVSVNVGRVDTLRLLDKLNPNRDVGDNVITAGGHMLSTESYASRLPRVTDASNALEAFDLSDLSMEARSDVVNQAGFGRDTVKLAQEATNLSVGKLLEVVVESDGAKATIPVAVRLMVNAIDPGTLVHTLSIGSKDNSAKERYHSWRAGQISFIRDLILCQDLIEEHRKNLIKDKSGIYEKTMNRRRGNRVSAILSGNPSVATASTMAIIADETRKELERKLGGKISNFRVRERFFAATYTMILCVVDTEWEQVTFYHRSIDGGTELSVKDIKSSNKGNGPDVAEILKAYQLGNSPSI